MEPRRFDDIIFSATLRPHRSLGRRGFVLLMAAIATLWFLTGLYFWSLGAWPVLGFFGLDFCLVLLLFKLNYRAARAYEEVEVSRAALVIRKVSAGGKAQELRFNPQWARLELHRSEDEGVTRIVVRTRGERVAVGSFLNPDDRTSFARAFGAALAEARR
jgi:uncharacterized membrane protein